MPFYRLAAPFSSAFFLEKEKRGCFADFTSSWHFFNATISLQVSRLQSFYVKSRQMSLWIQETQVARQDIIARFRPLLPLRNEKNYYHIFVSYR